MFDSQGQRHFAQRAGMRVKGGWSRGTFVYEQKTFEFYARNSYDERNNFLFPLFGEQHTEDGQLMHRYRRFRVRNGGTDREQSYLRDELSQELYTQAGFPDVQQHRPAVVFLNGEYYGLTWMKTPRTEDHWQRRYGGNEDNFKMLGSNERGRIGCGRIFCGRVIMGLGDERTERGTGPVRCSERVQCDRFDCADYHNSVEKGCVVGECRGVTEWEEIRQLALGTGGTTSPNGLVDNNNFAQFIQRVDIDNLIHYYALGMYVANVDWPGNNVEMWRYYPESDETDLHPFLADGKWRFVGQDLEFGYGLWSEGDIPSGTRHSENTLRHLIQRTAVPNRPGYGHFNATTQTFMMTSLLQRPDMRAKMANALIDVMEGAFEPTNAVATFNRLQRQIEREHRRMIEGPLRRISEVARDGGQGHWPDWGAVENSNRQIRNFLERRPAEKLRHIESELGFRQSDRSAVTFINGNGGNAVMNTRPVGEGQTVVGNYYNGTSITITAQPFAGYTADTPTVTVNVNGNVTVEMTYTRVGTGLHISEFTRDGITLTNGSNVTIGTGGLFLSDSNNDFLKFELEHVEIPAGESITVEPGFRLSLGERLRLSDVNSNVLQLVEVSRLSASQIQRLGRDGKWRIHGEGAVFVPPVVDTPITPNQPDNNNNQQNPPDNNNNQQNPPDNNNNQQNPPVSSGDVTATPTDTGVMIVGIPESGAWSVTVAVTAPSSHSDNPWPPTGGPWGAPDGVSFVYNNGMLTISGNGRHGWASDWNVTWGYW
jgi:hypothetical protein